MQVLTKSGVLFLYFLAFQVAAGSPEFAKVSLPPDSGAQPGKMVMEYSWRAREESGQESYSWDWRWSMEGGAPETIVLKRPPLIEWDVAWNGEKVGQLRDRFRGSLPVYPGVWGKGDWRSANYGTAEFQPPADARSDNRSEVFFLVRIPTRDRAALSGLTHELNRGFPQEIGSSNPRLCAFPANFSYLGPVAID